MQISLSRGESSAAKFVKDQVAKETHRLHQSAALGHESVLQELAEVWEECSLANWDGYHALPVEERAYYNAAKFALALPFGMARPSLGATPDGSITFDWTEAPRRTLTVSIGPDDDLHYAALFGPGRACGTEAFFGEVPEAILDLIRRVYA
jgi:hypothetical protein